MEQVKIIIEVFEMKYEGKEVLETNLFRCLKENVHLAAISKQLVGEAEENCVLDTEVSLYEFLKNY